jgi:hypothetical protein
MWQTRQAAAQVMRMLHPAAAQPQTRTSAARFAMCTSKA